MNRPAKVPISEQAQRAREHYEELANMAHHWSSVIPQAINAWERERLANTSFMSVTDELNELIALHGSARDALNVTLAKLRQAQSEIAVLKEAAQPTLANGLVLVCHHGNALPELCPECGKSSLYPTLR